MKKYIITEEQINIISSVTKRTLPLIYLESYVNPLFNILRSLEELEEKEDVKEEIIETPKKK